MERAHSRFKSGDVCRGLTDSRCGSKRRAAHCRSSMKGFASERTLFIFQFAVQLFHRKRTVVYISEVLASFWEAALDFGRACHEWIIVGVLVLRRF